MTERTVAKANATFNCYRDKTTCKMSNLKPSMKRTSTAKGQNTLKNLPKHVAVALTFKSRRQVRVLFLIIGVLGRLVLPTD